MGKLLAGMISEGLRFTRVRLDTTRPLPFLHRFDRILLDAPCSGTGTLARNPEIKWRLGPEDLMRLAEIQEKMLRQALEVLAPDGRLIYATCSLEPEENEHVVDKVLRDKPQFRLLDEAERAREYPALLSLFDTTGYFRTRPDLHSMDGFFAAVIVRVRQPTSTISLR
jgi:16S rRNA (cytosine967-C5)-methyltransferase